MNAAPVRRPLLGCLKATLRRTRRAKELEQYQQLRTFVATGRYRVAATAGKRKTTFERVENKAYGLFTPASNKKTPYAIYTSPPKPTTKEPLKHWTASSIAALDPTGARTALFSRARLDRAKVGDVLQVTTTTRPLGSGSGSGAGGRAGAGAAFSQQSFAGALMQIRRRSGGVDTAIQLRGNLHKTGVEMWFKIYSPSIVGIDVVWRRPRKARRARLMYLRHKKHDMGSVDDLVFAWKKERSRLRSTEKGSNVGTVFEPGRK